MLVLGSSISTLLDSLLKQARVKNRFVIAGSRRYACQMCKRDFKHAKHQNCHEQQVHNDTGDFKCKDCGSVFSRWENLNRHRQSHGGTLSLKCDICHKTFGWGDSLAQHQRQVHGGECYNCAYCKAIFTRKFNLEKHLKNTKRVREMNQIKNCMKNMWVIVMFLVLIKMLVHLHLNNQTRGNNKENK